MNTPDAAGPRLVRGPAAHRSLLVQILWLAGSCNTLATLRDLMLPYVGLSEADVRRASQRLVSAGHATPVEHVDYPGYRMVRGHGLQLTAEGERRALWLLCSRLPPWPVLPPDEEGPVALCNRKPEHPLALPDGFQLVCARRKLSVRSGSGEGRAYWWQLLLLPDAPLSQSETLRSLRAAGFLFAEASRDGHIWCFPADPSLTDGQLRSLEAALAAGRRREEVA